MNDSLQLWNSLSPEEQEELVSSLSPKEAQNLLALIEGEGAPSEPKAKVLSEAHKAKMETQGAIPTEAVTKPERGIVAETAANLWNPIKAGIGGTLRDVGGLASVVPAGMVGRGPFAPLNPIGSAYNTAATLSEHVFDHERDPISRGLDKVEDVVTTPGDALMGAGGEMVDEAISDADTTVGALNTAAVGAAGELLWDVALTGGALTALGSAKNLTKGAKAGSVGEKINRVATLLEEFTPSGRLPEETHAQRVQASARVEKQLADAGEDWARLEDAITSYVDEVVLPRREARNPGPAAVPEKGLYDPTGGHGERVRKVFRDRVDTALRTKDGIHFLPGANKVEEVLPNGQVIKHHEPGSIAEAAQVMRDRMDSIAKEAVHKSDEFEDFAVPRELRSIIQSNFGEYLHESYKGYQDPTWGRRIIKNSDNWDKDPEAAQIWNDMRDLVQKQYPKWTAKQVEGRLHELAKFDKMVPFFTLSKTGPIPGGATVTKKKKLTRHGDHQKIRRFLGLHENPKTGYLDSVAHAASYLEKQKLLVDEMVPTLEHLGLASPVPVANRTDIDGEGLDTLVPGTGKHGVPESYTTRAIARSLDFNSKVFTQSVYGMLNAMLKGNKTIWSLKTQSRNFLSSMMLTWSNGNLVTPFTKKGRKVLNDSRQVSRAIRNETVSSLPEELQDIARVLQERGILNSSVDVSEFRYQNGRLSGWLEDGEMFEVARHGGSAAAAKAKKGMDFLGDKPGKWYQWGDNYWKIASYQQEFLKYQDAYEAAGYNPHVAAQMAQERALQLVEDTVQNYNQLSPFARFMRDVPGVGAFSSFPLEATRNFVKTIEHSIREIRDPVTRSIGLRRATAFGTTVAGLPAAMTVAGLMNSNVSYEQMEAARVLLAEYDENTTLMPLDWDEETATITLLNTSHFQYHNNITNATQAIISGAYSDRPAGEIAYEVASESLGQIFGLDLAASSAWEFAQRSDYVPPKENLGRAINELAPGALTSDVVPLMRAAKIPGIKEYLPPDLRSGRVYEPEEELITFLGVRVLKIKADDVGKYHMVKSNRKIQRYKGILRDEIELQRSPVKIRQARQGLRDAWEREAPRMIRLIDAMRKLGVPDDFIEKEALSFMTKEEKISLLLGEVPEVYD